MLKRNTKETENKWVSRAAEQQRRNYKEMPKTRDISVNQDH